MKLGLITNSTALNFGAWGAGMAPNVAVVQEAEKLGYDIAWVYEAYGTDAVVPLSWLAAHTSKIKLGGLMQMTGRTPATAATTFATLDRATGGRVVMGLSASGPAVVEGWHSVPYRKPLARTEEYVEIVRRVIAKAGPVEYQGEFYKIPYREPDALGAAKPMTMAFRPRRRRIPLQLAVMGPAALTQAYRIAEGAMPAFYSPHREDHFFAGVTRRKQFELAPLVQTAIGNDVDACRDRLRAGISFFVGGMGPRDNNFYNRLVSRLGFEQEATAIQDAYLAGRQRDAGAAVTDALIDEVALAGPPERIRDQLEAWKESSVTTLLLCAADAETVRIMPELLGT